MKSSAHMRRLARNHKRMKQTPKLNLVSLMDIFTILVFFLLVNSSEVEVLQSNKDIKLPESVAEQKPEMTLVVMVSNSDLMVSGRPLVKVDEVLASEEQQIVALQAELQHQIERRPELTELEKKRGRAVTIMGDQSVPYKLLKQIMYTCAANEYRHISLAVSQMPLDAPAESLPDPEVVEEMASIDYGQGS